jgi:hypothetical protein
MSTLLKAASAGPSMCKVPTFVFARPALPAITEEIMLDVPVLIVGVAPPSVSVPPESAYPVTLKVMLCAVTPAAAIVTVPAAPPKMASFGIALFQAVFAPAVARLSQFVVPFCHVPLPPSALAVVSLPSQKRLCACAPANGPRHSAVASNQRCSVRGGALRVLTVRRLRVASSETTTHAPTSSDHTTW